MAIYRDTIRAVQSGQIKPVYILAGGDPFLEDYLVQEVTKRFLPEGELKTVYALDDDRPDKLMADLGSYGMFSQKRVFVVRQVGRAAGKAREELIGYAQKPDPDKCLFLILGEWQANKGLQKKLSKVVTVVDTRPPFPDKIRAWAKYFAKTEGYLFDDAALEYLLNICGDNVGHVVSEQRKIFSQIDEGATIKLELVKELVGGNRTFQLWQFQEAMAERNNSTVLRILVSLLEHGTNGVQIVNGLTNLFCQLLYLQSRTAAQGMYTGLNRTVSDKLGRMAKRYSPWETKNILGQLLSADIRLKSTGIESGSIMVPLVTSICKGEM